MNLARLSIKQTTLVIALMMVLIILGTSSFKSMSVDMYPEVEIPVVSVITIYPGAGASEIETLVSKPIEDQLSTISGLKRLTSKSLEGVSQVVAEFNQGADVREVEQEVKDKVDLAQKDLPNDVEKPIIRRFDPADLPIVTLALSGDLSSTQLFDMADNEIKSRLEQVNNVGSIEIYGGRKREIHVELDRKKLAPKDISVSQVATQIGAYGENIPSGKVTAGQKEIVFRGLGEFESVNQISNILVNLYGNEVPTSVGSIGIVRDSMEDEKNRTYIDGKPSLFMYVYKQSGANTIEVADDVKKVIEKLNTEYQQKDGNLQLQAIVDSSRAIKNNVFDVYETITIAIILTVLTVFFFLGSMRTTLITALSLPISLVGAFIAMSMFGFSLNIISLLALSLAVGLLVDDAIVVIENIHRRMQLGESAKVAAEKGTNEIQMSVFAITLVVVSVFVPVAFMSGTVGQFLKQFGLTIAFSMVVSLFVSLTLIPMLAAYFLPSEHQEKEPGIVWQKTIGVLLSGFNKFQDWLEVQYGKLLKIILKRPIIAIVSTLIVFALSLVVLKQVPSSFKPSNDAGELNVTLELEPGVSLDATEQVAKNVEKVIKSNKSVELVTLTAGGKNGESNKAEFFVRLKKGKARGGNTEQVMDKLRLELYDYAYAKPTIQEYSGAGAMGGQPIRLSLRGNNQQELESYAKKLLAHLEKDKRVKDVQSNLSLGKPEFRIKLSPSAANEYGVNSRTMGMELRAQVEGFTAGKYRENGNEYDIRVRLQPEQRNLKDNYNKILVPNVNRKLVRLADFSEVEETQGAAEINRQNRSRYVEITAGMAPGEGLSDVVKDIKKYLNEGDTKLPSHMSYAWAGDVENMEDMNTSSVMAVGFAIIFIYLILASLYGSFVTPITILVALPLALSGAFYALYIAGENMSIFAILGIFLLIGVAGKNSILLVDFANQSIAEGKSRMDAIYEAGVVRLRPILMTSFALIAGTIPVAIGLNEASKMRTSMGWAIIGGIVSSTILTLIVVPAMFSYVDRFRVWSKEKMAKIFLP